MKRDIWLKRYAIIFCILMVNGCSVFKQNSSIVKVDIPKQVATVPPEELTRDCERPEPFSKVLYLKSNALDKEDLLVKLNIEQYTASEVCNRRLKELRQWISTQKEILK